MSSLALAPERQDEDRLDAGRETIEGDVAARESTDEDQDAEHREDPVLERCQSLPSYDETRDAMKTAGPGYLLRLAAVLALAFGVMTIFSGGHVLFGGEAARHAAGAYVGFVLWFNFVAGFFYVAAAAGVWFGRPWAALLAVALAFSYVVVSALFGVHVLRGGAYETRTVAAMTVRCVFWILIAWLAWRRLGVVRGGRERS
ncbi:MAG: hypothetical protein ABI641_04180 [Caldimonas sp.]